MEEYVELQRMAIESRRGVRIALRPNAGKEVRGERGKSSEQVERTAD